MNVIQILKEWNGFIQFVKSDLRMRYLTDSGAGQEETDDLPRTFSGSFVLGYAILSLVMLLLSALAAVLIAFIAYRWIKNEKWIQFRPILTAILGTLLFVLGMLLIKADRGNPCSSPSTPGSRSPSSSRCSSASGATRRARPSASTSPPCCWRSSAS